jgi:hypothetical protein
VEYNLNNCPNSRDKLTDIDAAFEQHIFNLPQRKRIADIHHHREANYLWRTVEMGKSMPKCMAAGVFERNPVQAPASGTMPSARGQS